MFSAEWSKAKLMSQKDDDFTLRQRAKTKAGEPPLCCPQSPSAWNQTQAHNTRVKQLLCCLHSEFSRKIWLGLISPSRLWKESKQRKMFWIWSNFSLFKDGPGCRLKFYDYRANTIILFFLIPSFYNVLTQVQMIKCCIKYNLEVFYFNTGLHVMIKKKSYCCYFDRYCDCYLVHD